MLVRTGIPSSYLAAWTCRPAENMCGLTRTTPTPGTAVPCPRQPDAVAHGHALRTAGKCSVKAVGKCVGGVYDAVRR
jgi:hypothetical protein